MRAIVCFHLPFGIARQFALSIKDQAADQETIVVRRALPHGHVAAVLGTLRDIGLDRLLRPAGNRCRDLVIAMIVARLIAPASKLATARMLDPLTAAFNLGEALGLGAVDEDELYVALDWRASASRRSRSWRWSRLRPQFRDEPQNLLEHLPWDGDLGHLEGHIAAVAHHLRADLDQLVFQACQ